MYNREFPSGGNFLFFFSCKMSLLRLPCSKLPLAFLAVPAGKNGRVECPCQTFDGFIGIGGSVCGLFLFVQTHAPLDIRKQHTMCLLLCCLLFNICECGFQRGKVVLMLVNDLQNYMTLRIIGHLPRHKIQGRLRAEHGGLSALPCCVCDACGLCLL